MGLRSVRTHTWYRTFATPLRDMNRLPCIDLSLNCPLFFSTRVSVETSSSFSLPVVESPPSTLRSRGRTPRSGTLHELLGLLWIVPFTYSKEPPVRRRDFLTKVRPLQIFRRVHRYLISDVAPSYGVCQKQDNPDTFGTIVLEVTSVISLRRIRYTNRG